MLWHYAAPVRAGRASLTSSASLAWRRARAGSTRKPGAPGHAPAIFANSGLPAPADYQLMTATRAFYHEFPAVLVIETQVLDSRPGRVLLANSALFPGGGGQLPDRGLLKWAGGEAAVTGFEPSDQGVWHLL